MKDNLSNRAALKGENAEQAKELAGQYQQERLKGSQLFDKSSDAPLNSPGVGFGGNAKRNFSDRNSNGSGRRYVRPPIGMQNPGPMVDGPGPGLIVSDGRQRQGQDIDQDLDGLLAGDVNIAGLPGDQIQNGGEGPGDGEGEAPFALKAGLSLPLDLAEQGEKLTFFKSGGDARLAVGVRPGETWQFGGGLLWLIVWLLIGGTLALAFARQARAAALARLLAKAGIALGLVWFFLLPAGWLGFVLFAVSASVFSWQRRVVIAA